MLKMTEVYESKITHFTQEKQGMSNQIDEHRERLESALLERDKSVLKEQQLEKLIESLNSKQRD